MLMTKSAPSSAPLRSAWASMVGLAPSAAAAFRHNAAPTSSRSRSMSTYASRAPRNSGKERMSPVRFLEKTTLPAPIIAILIIYDPVR